MEKRVEEPEGRIGPRGRQRLILLFPLLGQTTVSLLPHADSLQSFLPPPRPRATTPHYLGCCLMADVFETAVSKEHGELASKCGVVPSRCPPLAIPPCALIAGVVGMRLIHWSNRAPVTVLIDEPASWSQALHHALDSRLLLAGQPEQHQT